MDSASLAGRVAFFGGSFDPPHLGHLAIARAAQTALELDTVLFAPVGTQPLKPQGASATYEDRLAMTRLAIADEPGFALSTIDGPRENEAAPNYTIDTLRSLRMQLPAGSVLFCLMGADSFLGLRQWHRAAELPFAAPFIVASRPGQPLDDIQAALPDGLAMHVLERTHVGEVELRTCTVSGPAGRHAPFYLLPGLDVEISASAIRAQMAARAESEVSLVPTAVAHYIQEHDLYR